jgi:acetyl-CoA acyltransferase
VIVAGGTESMSMVPMGGNKISPNPWLIDHYPDVYLNMGLTAENVARHYGITREQSDAFSLASHQKALAAIAAGKFRDEIIPVDVPTTAFASAAGANGEIATGKVTSSTIKFDVDEGPRADTSLDALAKLKPAFHAHGVVTAGNSSQMSDGAAASVIMSSEHAREIGVQPLARFISFAVAGCLPEEMGVGPVYAIPKALKLAGLKLEQIDVIELNEAFAAQVLACDRTLNMNRDRLNVNGGAIAIGHPIGCTGTRITVTLLHEMLKRNTRRGVATLCVSGGMGMALALENVV